MTKVLLNGLMLELDNAGLVDRLSSAQLELTLFNDGSGLRILEYQGDTYYENFWSARPILNQRGIQSFDDVHRAQTLTWGTKTANVITLEGQTSGVKVAFVFQVSGDLLPTSNIGPEAELFKNNVANNPISGPGLVDGAPLDPFSFSSFVSSGEDDYVAPDWGEYSRNIVSGGDGPDTIFGFDRGMGTARVKVHADPSLEHDTIYGGDGNDIIAGMSGDDLLFGGSGDDEIYGYGGRIPDSWAFKTGGTVFDSGNDTMFGGLGDDKLYGGGGDDSILGGDGNDFIVADNPPFYGDIAFNQRDTIFGGNGDDTVYAGFAADLIFGGSGHDLLKGGHGDDIVFGGNGRDTVYLEKGNDVFHDNTQDGYLGQDTVMGGDGSDRINGGAGNDVFFGGIHNDTLIGAKGNDRLFGGDNADKLYGGDGNDSLWGGNGIDQLTGGNGLDTFFFADGFGTDTVFGFDAADGEKISLAGATGITDFNDLITNHLNNAGGTAQIVDGANSILLNGVNFADIGVGLAYSGDDFVF